MLKIINENRFSEIYAIMAKSFPKDEIRPETEQYKLLSDSRYHIYVEESDGKYISFIAIWEFDDIIFIEHFATDPSYRCQGIGKDLLLRVMEEYQKTICLEVELPEDEITRRRVDFYSRLGFHLCSLPYTQPPISIGRSEIPLRIMTFPASIDADEFEKIKNTLYRNVYKILS